MLAALATALATGRLAALVACGRDTPAARPDGLGALVAGTVQIPESGFATLGVLAVSLAAAGFLQGPVAVLAGLAAALLLLRHGVARLGGITGDLLGALVEVAQTITLVILVLG